VQSRAAYGHVELLGDFPSERRMGASSEDLHGPWDMTIFEFAICLAIW
jgi:hypothetical protein